MTRAEAAALKAYRYKEGVKGLICEQSRGIFIKGYEQSEKDIGWNSVKKSLPPMGEEVIVLTNEMNGHELPDACHLCFAHRPDPKVAVCYDGWNIPGVKYWMYCPELPEE